jgi:hypothetical protein
MLLRKCQKRNLTKILYGTVDMHTFVGNYILNLNEIDGDCRNMIPQSGGREYNGG